MSKKINLADIETNIMSLLNRDKISLNIKFKRSKHTSKDRFSDNTTILLVELLPYIIIVSTCYYALPNANDNLDLKVKRGIEDLWLLLWKKMEAEKLTEIALYKKYILYIYEKMEVNMTREQFGSGRTIVQFDSVSLEHKAAFNSEPPNKRVNNIVLKLVGCGSEATKIRVGVIVNKQSDKEFNVHLADIVDKRRGN